MPSRPRYVTFALTVGGAMIALGANADTGDNAPNSAMRYVAVDVQSDSEHNRQLISALSLTFGDNWWANVGAGKTRSQQATATINPNLFSAGLGVAGQNLRFALAASSRKDGSRYRQRDWNSSLDWHNERFGVGIDGMHRNTDVESVVPVTGSQGNTVNIPVAESLTGNGFGLHGNVNLTERLNLFLGGMHYNYDTTTRQNGSVTVTGTNSGSLINTIVNNFLNNRPLLAEQVLIRTSAITREEAILDRSYNIGLMYQFTKLGLAAEYFNDRPFDSDDVATTVRVSAPIYIDEHWLVTPSIGRSSSDLLDDVTFGSLSVNFGW